jgi:hypothetical protein
MKTKWSHLWTVMVASILAIMSGSFFVTYLTAQNGLAQTTEPSPHVQISQSNFSGIQFTLETSPFLAKADGQIEITGLSTYLAEPGSPALPYYTTYIALPPEASASVQVQASEVRETAVPTIPPAPDTLFFQAEDVGLTAPPQEVYRQDEAIYGRNAYYPDALYTVSKPMYYRDIRLVALQVYPVRYNPVTGQLWQAQNLAVSVTFAGGRLDRVRPSPHANDHGLSQLILNNDIATNWRSLPANLLNTPDTELPIGTDVYKITVNEDGIYDVCQPELAAAGMPVGSVNPNTIQMLYRGEAVAYQFIGDTDNSFETDECVRFYGWKFAGSRAEKHFVSENVYWLWAGGTASTIATATNQLAGDVKTSVWYTQTEEPELDFFSTWTDQWPTFDNEPDAFYWDRINANATSGSYTIVLDEADDSFPTAEYVAEFSSAAADPNYQTRMFTVAAALNGAPNPASRTWLGRRNVNITGTVPTSVLINGNNTVAMTFDLDSRIYLNRISVSYMRQLIVEDDQFVLTDEVGGNPLRVTGFSSDNALVWDVTEPTNPTAVNMSTGVSGPGPYDYTFGLNHPAGSRFIATIEENIKTVSGISQYVPPDLNPADDAAEWLLITHASLLAQANQLAAHRASPQFGGLDTHVVDIQDIINQYGYGLPLPAAVQDYLRYALANWTIAPSYVVMFGDATMNPRGLPCSESCSTWDLNAPHLVLTDLPFVDRYQGLVPSDHTFVLLAGDDPLADMAIGRIAVEDSTQAANAVRKIITYESNPYTPGDDPPFLFIADDDDPEAGYFCDENELTATHVDSQYAITHMCQGTADYPDTATLRPAMFTAINNGAHTVNYRGHGSINRWAGGSDPIMTTADTTYWTNQDKPTVILSADCLDGHFAWPGLFSIAETFLRYDFSDRSYGSAAQWSSTGLGTTTEHTVLHTGFYDGLFVAFGQTMGNAINYSKLQYHQAGYHTSELYTFTLQGDPAMILYWAPEPPPPTPTPTLTNTPPPGASLTPTPTLTNTPPPGASLTPTPIVNFPVYLPVIEKP